LQTLVAAFISRRDFIASIPALYYSLSKDDLSILTAMMQRVAQRPPLPATQYTIRCSSGFSKQRRARILREAEKTLLGNAVNFPWPEVCDIWGIGDLGEAFRAPVKSKMPVLFISGTLDANAPPGNVEEMMKGLPNSIHLIVDGGEHEDFYLTSPVREQVREAIVAFMKGGKPATLRIKAPPIEFLVIKE
jgi:pimeloyl-ACP methyl ester carboxylesterase